MIATSRKKKKEDALLVTFLFLSIFLYQHWIFFFVRLPFSFFPILAYFVLMELILIYKLKSQTYENHLISFSYKNILLSIDRRGKVNSLISQISITGDWDFHCNTSLNFSKIYKRNFAWYVIILIYFLPYLTLD